MELFCLVRKGTHTIAAVCEGKPFAELIRTHKVSARILRIVISALFYNAFSEYHLTVVLRSHI